MYQLRVKRQDKWIKWGEYDNYDKAVKIGMIFLKSKQNYEVEIITNKGG